MKFEKKDYLYREGDKAKGIFILLTGLVALERVSEKGDLVIIRLLQRGAFFPYIDLVGDQVHTSAARALSDVTACFISLERLTEAVRETPRIGLAMIRLGSALMRENEDSILRLCSTEFSELVLSELRSLGSQAGKRTANGDLTFTLPMHWRDFAATVGITPESLSRLLRRLVKAGEISLRGHAITIFGRRAALPPAESAGSSWAHRRVS
jgi:CRP-like cAMP-binding protein